MTGWAQDRLDALVAGAEPPPVVRTLELGTLDAWGEGWVRKRWQPRPHLLNSDGSMFGGYLAALADQMLAFAAMTVLPAAAVFRTRGLSMTFHKVVHAQALVIEARVAGVQDGSIAVECAFRLDDGTLVAEARGEQTVRTLEVR
jgi:acyl-coenzyme A thioesterase PaaI-like protein